MVGERIKPVMVGRMFFENTGGVVRERREWLIVAEWDGDYPVVKAKNGQLEKLHTWVA